jgi:hypothetical protein
MKLSLSRSSPTPSIAAASPSGQLVSEFMQTWTQLVDRLRKTDYASPASSAAIHLAHEIESEKEQISAVSGCMEWRRPPALTKEPTLCMHGSMVHVVVPHCILAVWFSRHKSSAFCIKITIM